MTKEELKAALCAAIEKRLDDIRAIGMSIAEEPELGYKEVKTSAKVQEAFDRLGIAYETGFGVTGVKARLAGAGHRRTVALLGELDAIVCREHPMSGNRIPQQAARRKEDRILGRQGPDHRGRRF